MTVSHRAATIGWDPEGGAAFRMSWTCVISSPRKAIAADMHRTVSAAMTICAIIKPAKTIYKRSDIMAVKEIKAEELTWNPFTQIGKGWFLVTAGDEKASNTMTVSWGMIGELWGKDVVAVFVRPQRYTYEFMEKYGDFTLSFFGGEYKKALSFCGAKTRLKSAT